MFELRQFSKHLSLSNKLQTISRTCDFLGSNGGRKFFLSR